MQSFDVFFVSMSNCGNSMWTPCDLVMLAVIIKNLLSHQKWSMSIRSHRFLFIIFHCHVHRSNDITLRYLGKRHECLLLTTKKQFLGSQTTMKRAVPNFHQAAVFQLRQRPKLARNHRPGGKGKANGIYCITNQGQSCFNLKEKVYIYIYHIYIYIYIYILKQLIFFGPQYFKHTALDFQPIHFGFVPQLVQNWLSDHAQQVVRLPKAKRNRNSWTFRANINFVHMCSISGWFRNRLRSWSKIGFPAMQPLGVAQEPA